MQNGSDNCLITLPISHCDHGWLRRPAAMNSPSVETECQSRQKLILHNNEQKELAKTPIECIKYYSKYCDIVARASMSMEGIDLSYSAINTFHREVNFSNTCFACSTFVHTYAVVPMISLLFLCRPTD